MKNKQIIKYKQPMSTEDKLNFVRDYELSFPSPEELQPENFSYGLHRVLYFLFKHLESLKKSFLVLIDNRLDVDAFILAGVFLETISKFMYIDKPNDVTGKEERKNRYSAECILQRVKDFYKAKEIFEWSEDYELEKDFSTWLQSLKKECTCLLKNDKTDKHSEECYNYLINPETNTKNKIKYLNNKYEKPNVNKYIQEYAKQFEEMVDNMVKDSDDYKLIKPFYNSYCSAKHGNIFSIFKVDESRLTEGVIQYDYGNIREFSIVVMSRMLALLDEKKYCNVEFVIE